MLHKKTPMLTHQCFVKCHLKIIFFTFTTKVLNLFDMRKLVYIFFAMLAVVLVPSCRTTTEIHHYDTLTVERNVVQLKHDTVTIDSTKERIITEVIYDTIGRPYKVTKVEWRNKYITEQGAVEVVHDTITVQQGSKTSETKSTPAVGANITLWLIIICLAMVVPAVYKYLKK